MRTKAGGTAIIVSQEARPRFARLSRRRVCPVGAVSKTTWLNSVPSAAKRPTNSSNAAISVVHSGQLFTDGRALRLSGMLIHLGQDPLPISFGGLLGIDVHGGETRSAPHWTRLAVQHRAEHFVEIRSGIGANDQGRHALIRKCQRDRACKRRFPTPPLPVKKRKRVGAARTPSAGNSNIPTSGGQRQHYGVPRRCRPECGWNSVWRDLR